MKNVVIGALVVFGLLASIQLARAETKRTAVAGTDQPGPGPVGRWQIVHGPPTALYRTFLIDTVTGDSYMTCDVDRREGWCKLVRSDEPGVAQAPDASARAPRKQMPPGW